MSQFRTFDELNISEMETLKCTINGHIEWCEEGLESTYFNTVDSPGEIVSDFYFYTCLLYSYKDTLAMYNNYMQLYESALSHYRDSLGKNRQLGELLAQ